MLKKTLILGLILTSLIMFSVYSASALNETKTYDDDKDDVVKINLFSYEETIVTNKPNVDITKLKYEQSGKTITVTLTVKGNIENRGSLDDIYNQYLDMDEPSDDETIELSMDYVSYIFEIATISGSSEIRAYELVYVNKQCNITADYEKEIEPITCSATGSNLKISFNLLNSDEELDDISAITSDTKLTTAMLLLGKGDLFMDVVPDFEPLEVEINAPSEEKANNSVNFKAEINGGSYEYTYDWDFGDYTGQSTEQNPTYTYTAPGTYYAKVTVTDTILEESVSDTVKIEISPEGSDDTIDDTTKVEEEQKSTFPALFIFMALIAIVVIVGIAVVVFVIKR